MVVVVVVVVVVGVASCVVRLWERVLPSLSPRRCMNVGPDVDSEVVVLGVLLRLLPNSIVADDVCGCD